MSTSAQFFLLTDLEYTYSKYGKRECKDRNELDTRRLPSDFVRMDLNLCTNRCNANEQCISFELRVRRTPTFTRCFCVLSSSCTYKLSKRTNRNVVLYVKGN